MEESQNITINTGGRWWLLLIGIIIGISLGTSFKSWFERDVITESTDTLYIKDVVRVPYPVETARFKNQSIMMVPLWTTATNKKKDTVTIYDTVFLYVERETREYKGDSYFARVSGFNPSLDYIEVYPETKVVTNTERLAPHRNSLWLGLDARYMKGFQTPLYLEYERQFKNNFRLHGKAMYDFTSKSLGIEVGGKIGFGW